ncbi:hypothetical protein MLD38_011094 [Melastoma candidum]|uniref:Uncharacterized protein n=1 Tax=Melastoma candidum TaxID=119954 RepID=A0ACB9R1Y9_9MYRT|nr:hypothetical protein MLD38_011094 [Melastoma candidum]
MSVLLLRKVSLRRCITTPAAGSTIAAASSSSSSSSCNAIPENPTSAYYDDRVREAALSDDPAALVSLLNKRVRDRCFNTARTFNFLTNTAASLQSLPSLIETLSRLPRGFARKNAFDALVHRLCKLDQRDHARHVLDVMSKLGDGLNAASFHPFLLSLDHSGLKEARRVVDIMREHQVSPDTAAYNFLLMACCARGDVGSAAGVLEEMEGEGVNADSRTYHAMVLGAVKAGKVDAAFDVLCRMADDGVSPLYATLVVLIKWMASRELWGEAVELVSAYKGRSAGLDAESFGVLASEMIRKGRKAEAAAVVEEMARMGLRLGNKLTEFRNEMAKK